MGIYKIMVTVSNHDALKEGRTALHWAVNGREPFQRQVIVEADSDGEAMLIASQMASCTGRMCTGAVLSDWPGSPLDDSAA